MGPAVRRLRRRVGAAAPEGSGATPADPDPEPEPARGTPVMELSTIGVDMSASEPRTARAWRWALGAVAAMLAWAYAPNFRDLSTIWSAVPDYSHGFLVAPIALFILWRRLAERPWDPSRGAVAAPWWGGVLLGAILAVRVVAYEGNFQWVENATLLPALACLTWTFGGWPLLHRAWPAIVFLIFMLPLPNAVNSMISLSLQQIAASGSYILLQLAGFWAIQQGNTIVLSTPYGMRPLDVAQACSGLKMLMTLIATVTATLMLVPLPLWKRGTLLLSAVPIALVSNMIRIVATGWCYYYIRGERAQDWAHDISGWMMMPLALILVGLELVLLSWLVPERAEDEADKAIIPLLTDRGPGKSERANTDLSELSP
jgi:exosortase